MNSHKKNFLVISLIFIIPIALYYMFKSDSCSNYSFNIAQALTTKKPTVIDFTSEMCYECKQLDKVLNPAKIKYKDQIIFREIPINSNNPEFEKLINKYNVNVVPTMVFINKDGQVEDTTKGRLSKSELEGYLDKLIDG